MPSPYSDDYKYKPDYPWQTDIEKIQAEIAMDLERAQQAAQAAIVPVHEDGMSWPDDALPQDPWLTPEPALPPEPWGTADTAPPQAPWLAPEAKPLAAKLAAPPYSAPQPPEPAGFYRETIKVAPQRQRSWAKMIAVLLLVCTLGMGSLGFGLSSAFFWVRGQSQGINSAEPGDNPNTPTITSNQYVFDASEGTRAGTVADMVQMLEPSVVSITTRFEGGVRAPVAGSGTIFGENETRIFIVTGHYVIRGHAQISVRISGSQPIIAREVSSDHRAGLSVISIDKQQLLEAGIDSVVIANFGDSSQMQVGDTVFAIGNARNEGNSVTRGIISAGKQDLVFPGYTLTVLQTDAAINYGNSGGPLINISGEVIGINIDRASAQFGQAQVEGIGYSIASNVALPIVQAIIDPNRPGLGIMGQTLDEERAARMGIPAMGVLVAGVMPGGAADVGGLQADDIITSFAGEPVFTMEELQQAIRRRHIGDTVEVRILRGTASMVLDVELLAFIRE